MFGSTTLRPTYFSDVPAEVFEVTTYFSEVTTDFFEVTTYFSDVTADSFETPTYFSDVLNFLPVSKDSKKPLWSHLCHRSNS